MPAASDSRGRLIVGTAGHVDHGKTSLLEALTGIDCDRWQEEKDRGITIDLGFAHLEKDDLQIGFVDVPGHERFVDNALAGLGGIRIMLLVVAADEGVMPQTREHLEICSLLGIPAGLVALTKIDLVADDVAELARLEIEELLRDGPFGEAPIVPVSSETGFGIEELERRLLELARKQVSGEASGTLASTLAAPARLPIDRSFILQGLGIVVTGTPVAGRIATGDHLETAPGRLGVRVRSVQVHGQDRSQALTGERTALRLAGAELDQLARGTELVAPGAYFESDRLAARMSLLESAPKAISGWVPVRFHLFSAERPGRLRALDGAIEPGGTGLVEIRLSRPVVAVPGNRWICRRLSPATTLGGGEVLDPAWRPVRGRRKQAALASLVAELTDRVGFWIGRSGLVGMTTSELARRSGVTVEATDALLGGLVADSTILGVSGAGARRRWIAPRAFRRLEAKAGELLADYFDRHRLADGIPKAEAVHRLLPARARDLADTYLEWLAKRGVLAVDGDRVNAPGREARLSKEESRLSRTVLALFEKGGLDPPSPAELRAAAGAKPQVLDGVVRFHVQRGDLSRLPGDLVIAASAVARVRKELEESGEDSFAVADFKQRFGLTRKWAIPLLEHLDSIGVTRRVGNQRQLVGKADRNAG